MLYATYGTFWFGVLAYLAATGLVLGSLKAGESRRWLYRGTVAAVAGAALLAVTQILRFVVWRHVPLTTSTDSLNLFVVLGTIVAVWVSWEPRRRGLILQAQGRHFDFLRRGSHDPRLFHFPGRISQRPAGIWMRFTHRSDCVLLG